jgi:hypothetical protein
VEGNHTKTILNHSAENFYFYPIDDRWSMSTLTFLATSSG